MLSRVAGHRLLEMRVFQHDRARHEGVGCSWAKCMHLVACQAVAHYCTAQCRGAKQQQDKHAGRGCNALGWAGPRQQRMGWDGADTVRGWWSAESGGCTSSPPERGRRLRRLMLKRRLRSWGGPHEGRGA